MATPNDLYGWFPGNQMQMPDRWMTIPGQSTTGAPVPQGNPGMLGWMSTPGEMSGLAQQLAGAQRMKPGGGASFGASDMYGSGESYADTGGGDASGPNGKVAGAASGAATGWQYGGPWGAVLGGVAGYALNGGAKDLNPIEASGFTGLTMDQAWEDENLARLGSNPAGALAQKYIGYNSALSPTSWWGGGINENSFLGKALDPVRAMDPGSIFESGNNPEEKTRDQYYSELNAGNMFTDPKLFTEGVVGEFRASRSTYPPRASGQYGAKDDDKFAADMATKINSAYQSGQIDAGDDAYSIYEKVITPWFDTMGSGMNASKAPEAHTNMTIDMIQRYMSGSPITWQQARGGTPEYEVPAYLGMGG
jgi:hypothetical protein